MVISPSTATSIGLWVGAGCLALLVLWLLVAAAFNWLGARLGWGEAHWAEWWAWAERQLGMWIRIIIGITALTAVVLTIYAASLAEGRPDTVPADAQCVAWDTWGRCTQWVASHR